MIKINLVRKRISAGAAPDREGTRTKISLDTLRSISQGGGQSLAPLFLKFGLPVLIAIIANYGLDFYMQGVKDGMSQELASITAEKDKINKEIQKIKGFESTKTELERNSLIIRSKIDTIENLIKGRDFTAKALMSLVQSLPKDAWLTEVVQTDKGYTLRGGAIDIGLISDFMSRLGRTIYFKDVTLKSTSSDASAKRSNFELSARRD